MTDEQIIKKAKNALIKMNLFSKSFTEISVSREIYPEMLEDFPEHEFEYKVHFSDKEPVSTKKGRVGVAVDRKTHKLLYAIKLEGSYEIPEHLK